MNSKKTIYFVYIKSILLIIIFHCLYTDTFAQYTVNAYVKYQNNDGEYSDYFQRDVDLISGSKLNRSTSSSNYSYNSDYVLVWFSNNQVAIIELETVRFSSTFNSEITDISFDIGKQINGIKHKGIDENGVQWYICFTAPFYESYVCN